MTVVVVSYIHWIKYNCLKDLASSTTLLLMRIFLLALITLSLETNIYTHYNYLPHRETLKKDTIWPRNRSVIPEHSTVRSGSEGHNMTSEQRGDPTAQHSTVRSGLRTRCCRGPGSTPACSGCWSKTWGPHRPRWGWAGSTPGRRWPSQAWASVRGRAPSPQSAAPGRSGAKGEGRERGDGEDTVSEKRVQHTVSYNVPMYHFIALMKVNKNVAKRCNTTIKWSFGTWYDMVCWIYDLIIMYPLKVSLDLPHRERRHCVCQNISVSVSGSVYLFAVVF